MPDPTPPAPTPAPAPGATQEIPMLVDGRREHGLGLRKEKGKIVLRLNVAGLHAYLDAIGVDKDPSYLRYANAPNSRADVLDTGENALVPKALCSYAYAKDPATGAVRPGILEWDVMRIYQTPPTLDTMEEIARSVSAAVTAVVSHYQPVEISLTVVGKKGAK